MVGCIHTSNYTGSCIRSGTTTNHPWRSSCSSFPRIPAEKSELQCDDLLFRIDGQVIQSYRVEDAEVFGNMLKQYKINSTITLSGQRNGEAFDLQVTLNKRPEPPNELPKYEEETFEFTLRELSFGDRVNRRLDLNQSDSSSKMLNRQVGSLRWA